jgi:hypothetical protein
VVNLVSLLLILSLGCSMLVPLGEPHSEDDDAFFVGHNYEVGAFLWMLRFSMVDCMALTASMIASMLLMVSAFRGSVCGSNPQVEDDEATEAGTSTVDRARSACQVTPTANKSGLHATYDRFPWVFRSFAVVVRVTK